MSLTDKFVDSQDGLNLVIRADNSHPYSRSLVGHHLSFALCYHAVDKVRDGEECLQVLPRTVDECFKVPTYAREDGGRESPHIHGDQRILFKLHPFVQFIEVSVQTIVYVPGAIRPKIVPLFTEEETLLLRVRVPS